jgi:hypothetical protein
MRRLVQASLLAAAPLALSLGLAGSAPAQPRPAQASTILTGDWEYNYRIGPIPAGKENKCLGPAEVRRFAEGICTSHYRCDYDVKTVADGKVALKGVWVDKKGRSAPVTASGVYGPEAFTLNIRLKTTGGIPLAGVMNARRVSPTCAAGAK